VNLIAQARDQGARLSARLTPRARLGLAMLAALLLVVAIANLSEHVATQRVEAQQMQRELRVYRALAAESNWAERAAEISRSLERSQAAFWRGRTPGIVSAQLQGEVTRLAIASGLERVNVEIRPDPLPLGDEAVYFELRLTGEDRNGQFLALFDNLATYENLLVPSGVEWQRANGTIRIQLLAPAILETEAGQVP